VAVAVPSLDSPVQTMNNKLSALIETDLPSGINCIPLGIEVAAVPTSTAPFDIPTAFGIWNYVVGIGFLSHICLRLQ